MAETPMHRQYKRIKKQFPDAIVFFIRPGELVLANAVSIIVGDRGRANQSELNVLPHRQAIRIIARLPIALENALIDHSLQVGCGLRIHLRRERSGRRRHG